MTAKKEKPEMAEKSGFEVMLEVESITAELTSLADVLELLKQSYGLDQERPTAGETFDFCASRQMINSTISVVQRSLFNVSAQLEAIQLTK